MAKLTKNFSIYIIIAGLIIGGAVIYTHQKGCNDAANISENILTAQEAAEKAVDFINKYLLEEGATASLIDVSEESGVYKFKLKIGENEMDSYVTKDGKLLFPQVIDLKEELATEEENVTQEVSKTDVPDLKLFVMSYCPFGLQAQKGFLPVYNLLKDRAEMGIYFVDYIMHEKEEIDENLRQYCIQKEEVEKFADYLSCFVEEGKSEECLSLARIDEVKLSFCISVTDEQYKITEKYNNKDTWRNGRFPEFPVHTDLNKEYGVGGSPTFVINGVVVSINRSPEKIKEAVCEAFNSEPEECSQVLSEETPSSGFGGGTGGSSGGACK